jgi:hypothetical protein
MRGAAEFLSNRFALVLFKNQLLGLFHAVKEKILYFGPIGSLLSLNSLYSRVILSNIINFLLCCFYLRALCFIIVFEKSENLLFDDIVICPLLRETFKHHFFNFVFHNRVLGRKAPFLGCFCHSSSFFAKKIYDITFSIWVIEMRPAYDLLLCNERG